jgi:hypothetical protein
MRTSNFSIKAVKLSVWQASAHDLASVPKPRTWASNRTPADFRQPLIKADRALRRDPAYQPQFTNVPIRYAPLEITLDEVEFAALKAAGLDEFYGHDSGAALRDVLFSWWETQHL